MIIRFEGASVIYRMLSSTLMTAWKHLMLTVTFFGILIGLFPILSHEKYGSLAKRLQALTADQMYEDHVALFFICFKMALIYYVLYNLYRTISEKMSSPEPEHPTNPPSIAFGIWDFFLCFLRNLINYC
jgi:hypothetical protein